jgi:hypothetical protein
VILGFSKLFQEAINFQYRFGSRQIMSNLAFPGMSAADVELRVDKSPKNSLMSFVQLHHDPEGELIEVVPQEDYRKVFLKSAQDLAPPTNR